MISLARPHTRDLLRRILAMRRHLPAKRIAYLIGFSPRSVQRYIRIDRDRREDDRRQAHRWTKDRRGTSRRAKVSFLPHALLTKSV